jgi:Flp pilus assembly pilin Flp
MRRLCDRIQRFYGFGLALASSRSTSREEGQTFVEYAVLLGVVVVAMAAALTFLEGQIGALYTKIANDFNAALP